MDTINTLNIMNNQIPVKSAKRQRRQTFDPDTPPPASVKNSIKLIIIDTIKEEETPKGTYECAAQYITELFDNYLNKNKQK